MSTMLIHHFRDTLNPEKKETLTTMNVQHCLNKKKQMEKIDKFIELLNKLNYQNQTVFFF